MQQKYLKPLIAASLAIMVYQGIANSNLGILSQFTRQNGNKWAGPLSTALLFLASGIGSFYNSYIGKYPFRLCFFVGAFGYIIFTSLGMLFLKLGFTTLVQVLIFVFSTIGGAICSIFYNSQFNYTNFLGKIDQREVKYFGINMGISQSCNIFGNLLSSLIIKPLGQFYSVLVMTIVLFLTSCTFLFFKQPEQSELQRVMKGQQSKEIQEKEESLNTGNNEGQSVAVAENVRVPIPAWSAFIFSGAIISFIYSLLAIILYETFSDKMEDIELNKLTFEVFIFEGVGELLGGMAVVFLSTKIKDVSKAIIAANSLFLVALGIIWMASYLENQILFAAGAVVIGISDCACFSLGLALAGNWKHRGISAFIMGQAATVAVNVMLGVFVPMWVSLAWILLLFIWNLASMVYYSKTIARRSVIVH